MKVNVKIGDKVFEVEIEDVNTRPIVARVDGEAFEVFPENAPQAAGGAKVAEIKPGADAKSVLVEAARAGAAIPNPGLSGKSLLAPLPGTVVEVFVRPDEYVEAGHVMLVIEAMKMKNSIRSTRSGTVSKVLVSAGQTVAHKQSLVEYAE